MPAWHAPNLAINCIENTREKNASEDPYQYGSFFSLLHSGRFEVISFSSFLDHPDSFKQFRLVFTGFYNDTDTFLECIYI